MHAQVRDGGDVAVKVAHPNPVCRARVAREVELFAEVVRLEPDLSLPELFAVGQDRAAFVREKLAGPSVLELLEAGRGELEEAVFALVCRTYEATERFRRSTQVVLDFTPPNLFVDPERGRVVLADVGERIDRHLFPDLTPEGLREALRGYLPWRRKMFGTTRPERLVFPPSGRFHVEVAVGPVPGARLLWVNERLKETLRLDWTSETLLSLSNLSTDAPQKTVLRPASRYQDSAQANEQGAKGDGRAVYLGTVKGGPYSISELQLKGCGPTPLAWKGHAFHEDGRVSFQRTLWEVSVADELARLGFETPQMLAILSTEAFTVDNTLERWPAAAAVRVSSTHLRFGHVKLWGRDGAAMKAVLELGGRRMIRPDFNADDPRDLKSMVQRFTENLGHDTGKTDALNIHCFNPTMGNVRLDGRFIDFSTVRFFRNYMPFFPVINGRREVRGHKLLWRLYPPLLVKVLGFARLVESQWIEGMLVDCRRRFDRAYVQGYLEGFFQFLGVPPPEQVSRSLATFVERTQALKRLRAREALDFKFWRTTHAAPLFDVEGLLPELVDAWRSGQKEPWRVLRSPYDGEVTADDRAVARRWFASLAKHVDPTALQPRRWDQVIRPFMELEALGWLCYRRSRPEAFDEWKRLIEGGWAQAAAA
jgi:hypothetical protein